MDDNPSPEYRGWIKLEFPCLDKNKEVIRWQEAKLQPALRRFGITVISRSSIHTVQEQYCEPYHEINYEVTCNCFNTNLLLAIQKYLKDVTQLNLCPFQQGTLMLHSPDFWTSELLCHLSDVPLSAIYFGNLQGGKFLNHWQVSFWEETNRRHQCDYINKVNYTRAKDWLDLNRIKCEFEFDKMDFITINFRQREELRENGANSQDVVTFYEITIKRSSVRRIIVDPVSKSYGSSCYRIHFELNCPVMIRRGFFTQRQLAAGKFFLPVFTRRLVINRGKNKGEWPNALAISDSPIFTMEFDPSVSVDEVYRILSRLRFRTGIPIEFGDFPANDCLFGRWNPYHRWTITNDAILSPTSFDAPVYSDFVQAAFGKEAARSKGEDVKERRFAITYLIECLLSRGAVVKDNLLLDELVWHRFLETVLYYYKKDNKLCEAALEDLVHMIDGKKRVGNIMTCFDRICQNREKLSLINGLTQEELREGYQRVRKIVFTPTRVIYVAPETLMGNRVLRRYDHDGTRILRITFRDDNNGKLTSMRASIPILESTVNKFLKNGIVVAGRNFGYLGSSNSQMRDNGAYFMEKCSSLNRWEYIQKFKIEPPLSYNPNIQEARKNLGRFEKIDNIPKLMARLGQCFTQSRLSGVNLERSSYITMFDLNGGKNSNGSEFTFSDGVGMMSLQFAEKISSLMNFGKGVPSCFQFRFRGMKGVIAVEPLLDEMRRWALTREIEKPGQDAIWGLNCVFRPSQIKFISKRHPRDQVEIVKYSSPVPVALNKPFINILDQVSEMQSLDCHRRVTNRIEELLDKQMLMFAAQLVNETKCRNRLKEFPHRIDIDYLKTTWGFTLSSEPFFRSLIKASIKFSITKQLMKEQISIPSELGRSMLGVVDETGRLQYGQIFVQYTKSMALKLPPPTAARKVLTGKVLLTKNPCIVAGDVRVFEAVDIPELHHMCDVVVFPQHGPRPHPDEMAGSDLDGDEYSVIWDQDLLIDRNEEPFDFAADKKKQTFDESQIDDLMREFYVRYVELDSVGTIANNHLHCSDQYGLNARVCMDLAKKNCQAVDFTKSGEPPKPLELKWRTDEKTGELIPPERAERVPDYHMSSDQAPIYVSPRLCGKLFREFKAIDDVLKISEERDELLEVSIDESIMIEGYEKYIKAAREDLAKYNAELRSIMEHYGLKTEGETFSGCIIEMRNRISDKDQDDMSFFNTNLMIETKVTGLVKKYRELFFDEFEGGWIMNTEPTPKAYDENNILQRLCRNPSEQQMKKAVAWYRACYEEAKSTSEAKKLSFAWTVYDVIGKVKQLEILRNESAQIGASNPLYKLMETHRKQYMQDNRKDFSEFKKLNFTRVNGKHGKKAMDILKCNMMNNPGLEDILFMLIRWAESANLFDNGSLQMHHFSMLFIMFLTNQFPSVDGNVELFIDKIDEEAFSQDQESETFVPNQRIPDKELSKMMIKFFEFLASRRFRKLRYLSFRSIGFMSIFMRGEWQCFHVAAFKTYYNILFNLRFEELPISTDPTITVRTIIRENEPFLIELPANFDRAMIQQKLREYTGVQEVQLRRMERLKKAEENQNPNVRLLVSARGSLESVYKLKQLVLVKVPLKTYVTGKEASAQLAKLCYEKIINGNWGT